MIRWIAAIIPIVAIVAGRRRKSAPEQPARDAHAARRVLASHYDALHRFANDIILLLDDAGRIIEANERAVAAYGYTREELLALNIRDLRDPSDLPGLEADWGAAQCVEGAVFEASHRRRDGSLFPIEVSSRVIEAEGHRFRQCIIRDITERRRAEEELRRSQATFSRAQAIAHIGSWEIDLPGGGDPYQAVCRWSDEVYRIFGLSKQEVQPSHELFLRSLHAEDRERVIATATAAVANGRLLQVEHRIVRPDGQVRHVREHGEIVRDASGRAVQMAGTVQDITDYEHLQRQFLQAQKLESIGRLAGGVAHDFNNLLTVINGYAELALSDAPEGSPLRDAISEIRSAGEKASALTQQLLAFSRKQVMLPALLDMNEVVAEAQRMLRRVVGEDITITTKLDPAIGPVLADSGQIQQVLMNLVVNSRDAMPHGGCIFIETCESTLNGRFSAEMPDMMPGSYVVLSVSDTGSGIAAEARRHLFEPFFTTKPKGSGTGLGLATVYGIVRQSGGWVHAYSEPGHGATFRIYLPRAATHETASRIASVNPPAVAGTETILIAEDQSEVRKFTAAALRSFGYRVLEAEGADEAAALSREYKESIHLLLTDVVMPGHSGLELAAEVRRARPELRVVFMSGYTQDVVEHRGAIDANSAYISKPFSPEGLAAAVRTALDAR